MSSERVKKTIRNFFHGDVSNELRLQFYAWFTSNSSKEEKEESLFDMWNESFVPANKSTIEDLKRVQRIIWEKPQLSFIQKLLRVAAAITLPIIGALLTIWLNQSLDDDTAKLNMIQCYVPIGEERTIILPDGSNVILKSGTLLIYPESFDKNVRDIYLSGNGNFSVAKDKKRPFTVKTSHLGITALGTIFSVDAGPGSDETIATLEEGKIRVHTLQGDGLSEILLPNEQIVYNNVNNTYSKQIVDSHILTQRKTKALVFQSERFENIIKALEGYYKVNINYENGVHSTRVLTIRFSENETLEQSLAVLSQMVPEMKFSIKKNEVIIRIE